MCIKYVNSLILFITFAFIGDHINYNEKIT